MESPKKPLFKRWYFWVLVVLVLAAIGSALGEEDAEPWPDRRVKSGKYIGWRKQVAKK